MTTETSSTQARRKPVIVSVPHSGTRSLVKMLELNEPGPPLQHFGQHDGHMSRLGELHLHIPIRDPMLVCYSWCRRRHHEDQMVRSYMSMFEFLALPEEVCPRTLYRMENFKPLEGCDEEKHRFPPSLAVQARWRSLLWNQVVLPHLDFFLPFYPYLTEEMECSNP
jgi:hypothetical protein